MYAKVKIYGKAKELIKICRHLEYNGYHFESMFHVSDSCNDHSVNIYILEDEIEYLKTILLDNHYDFEVED